MTNALQVLTTRNLNGVKFNCYHEDGQDAGDFWATREQIGELLGYEDPRDAIKKIHRRNRERLDKFSQTVQVANNKKGGGQNDTPFGKCSNCNGLQLQGLVRNLPLFKSAES